MPRKVVENYDENMSLMVRTQGGSEKRMVRIYFPKARQYLYRSLKLDYEVSNASLNEARRRADKIIPDYIRFECICILDELNKFGGDEGDVQIACWDIRKGDSFLNAL